MSSSPFFSIIIPTYNRAHVLGRTIDSVLSQSYADFELIIVDDGSTDKTNQLVESYEDERIKYYMISHGERSRARNYGVTKTRGKYVCFLDSDDTFLQHHLQVFNDAISFHDFIDNIYISGLVLNNGTQHIKMAIFSKEKHESIFSFILRHKVGIHDFVFPIALFSQHLFSESYFTWQDKHFYLRAICIYPIVSIFHHTHLYNESRRLAGSKTSVIHSYLSTQLAAIMDLETSYSELFSKQSLPSNYFNCLKAKRILYSAYNLMLSGENKEAIISIKRAFLFSRNIYFLTLYLKFFTLLLINNLKFSLPLKTK